ncbi:hypothetical protein V2J09_010289 [Rumex salicifolius]
MFSNFLYTLFSITFLIILPTKATTFTKDIVNQTCKSCSETAPSPSDFSFDFCSASLGTVPVSHTTNLPGLGLIALELAVENSTKTLTIINQMLQDDSESDSLQTCFELYTDVTVKLKECVVDYMDMAYEPVFMWVILIREAAVICEEGFGEEGSESPLTCLDARLIAGGGRHLRPYSIPLNSK